MTSTTDVLLTVFRVLSSSTSLCMLLSPCFMVYEFFQTKTMGVMSIVPLVSLLVNSHAWMVYGYLDHNYVPVFVTFAFGDVLALGFLLVFYRYTPDRARANRALAITAVLIILMTLYLFLGAFDLLGQSREATANTAGTFAVVTTTALYASPLEKILHVFKHKSAVLLPIHMIWAGTANNAVWLTYSLLASKWLITAVDVSSLAICVFQLVLYVAVFPPSTHPYTSEASTCDDETSDCEFATLDSTRIKV